MKFSRMEDYSGNAWKAAQGKAAARLERFVSGNFATLGAERYKSNKRTTADAAGGGGGGGGGGGNASWRLAAAGSRGCTEAAGWRARASGSIRAPGATQGEKQQSVSPFPPGKVLATVRYLARPCPVRQGRRRICRGAESRSARCHRVTEVIVKKKDLSWHRIEW